MSGMRPCRDGGSAAERTTAPAAIAVGHFLCRASAKVYFWWHGALKARPISSADLGTAPVTPSKAPYGGESGSDRQKPSPAPAALACRSTAVIAQLSLIHISEPTRRTPISYAVFCLK